MKPVKLSHLRPGTKTERIKKLADTLKKGEGLPVREVAEEIGCDLTLVTKVANSIGGSVVLASEDSTHRPTQYLVNPKYNDYAEEA